MNLIEFCFSYKTQIEKAVVEKRLDPNGTNITGGNGSGHSRIGDPTANKAVRNVTEVERVVVFYGAKVKGERPYMTVTRPETWLKVVASTEEIYKGKLQESIIDRRYRKSEDWKKTCTELNISKGQYYAALNDLMHQAELFAVGYGVMTPWSKER